MSGFFWSPWDEPAPGSLIPRPRGIDPELLQAIGFGRLGRPYEDPPDWKRIPIDPYVDSRMQMFLPPPDVYYNMPIYRTEKQVRPRDAIPPWVGPDGWPHLDDMNPNYYQNVSPGWWL